MTVTTTIDKDQEIAKLKKLVAEQQARLHQLQCVIDNLPGSIYWKDLDGVYLGRNRYATTSMQKLGFEFHSRDDDVVGKTDYDLFSKAVADQFRRHDLEVMNTEKELSVEESSTLPNGKLFTQLSTKRPLRDMTGNVIGVIGNTIEISYLKKIEKELRAAKDQAEEADRIKSQFIRNMEHDIRTPFNGIWGMSNFLLQKETDEEKRTYLLDIVHCSKDLLDYCNGILDFSRIELGALPVATVKFDLKQLVESVIKMETPPAKYKHLALTLHYQDIIPQAVIGDQYRLLRILINLVSNAIKFTPEGGVTLSVEVLKKTDVAVKVRFSVIDTGIGIPEDKRDFIYDKFSRLQPSSSTTYKGLGLGLPVVKQFISEMGGSIDVTSELGKGSVFSFELTFKL